jgi:hypothetical protein
MIYDDGINPNKEVAHSLARPLLHASRGGVIFFVQKYSREARQRQFAAGFLDYYIGSSYFCDVAHLHPTSYPFKISNKVPSEIVFFCI